MDLYFSTEPITSPLWANIAPYQPPTGGKSSARTEFGTQSFDDFFKVPTGLSAPTPAPMALPKDHLVATVPLVENRKKEIVGSTISESNEEIHKIARQRVQLLAAKYAKGSETTEIIARLEMLNRRLLEKSPRISDVQVAALEDAHQKLINMQLARKDRAKRLGIPV